MQTNEQLLFTEIFPIKTDTLPELFVYKANISSGDLSTIGGKLAYQIKNVFADHWAWAGGKLVSDLDIEESEIQTIIETLWSEQPDIFRGLQGVTYDPNAKLSAQGIAEFVVRGLLSDKSQMVHNDLARRRQDLGKIYVERYSEFHSWVVDGQPAVSISLYSRMVYKQSCAEYARQVGENKLIGLLVGDKFSNFKGEVSGIVGQLGTERKRLLKLTKRKESIELISKAPDTEIVVSVKNGHSQPYDYVLSGLRIIPRMEDLRQFGIDGSKALATLRLEPSYRAKIVGEVADMISDPYLERAYNSGKKPNLFMITPYSTDILMGNGRTVVYDEKSLMPNLKRNGLYKVANKFQGGALLHIGILDILGSANSPFLDNLQSQLKSLGFSIQIVGKVQTNSGSRLEIDKAVTKLEQYSPDILLAFLPDQYDEDDEDSTYFHLKSLSVGRSLPSQVVEKSTQTKPYTIGNIVMGVLGKTGNIPYVLAEPLDFADIVVGIDIARGKKKNLPGSVNATAITRIYLNNGEFLEYAIHDAPLEGETIPPDVLQSMFPVSIFSGKRVVIHRDGYFRGTEKQALLAWAKQIDAQFHLVEVIKSGSPRMYRTGKEGAGQPSKGSAFLLTRTEAILVSSLPPFANSTPQPLRIRTESSLTIEQALQSVLAMSTLHYGSLRPPRLPVTIHYSDKIAGMALKGIKPKNLEGNIPFWL